jgi:hypothetical protein
MANQYERDIVNAIETRKSLLVQVHSLLILIEPYLLGMGRNYKYVLFGYQINGEGRGYEAAWVGFLLNEISCIYTTERKFYYDHKGYEANKPEFKWLYANPRSLPVLYKPFQIFF